MNTQLLDAIRIIIKEELKKQDKKIDAKFKTIDYRLKKQDDKLDAILEAWEIQKEHRVQLNDHEDRIRAIEYHIPTIS